MPEQATLENPAIKPGQLEPEALDLLRMAQEADAGKPAEPQGGMMTTETQVPIEPEPPKQPTPDPEPATEPPKPTPEPEVKPEPDLGEEAKKADDERARDEHGRFVKQEEAAKAPEPAKPDTAYEKAKKEQERKEKTWQKLQERREELERKEAAIAAREQELERLRNQPPPPQPDRFTVKQYSDFANESFVAAQRAEAEGDYATAAEQYSIGVKARAAADRARETESQIQASQAQSEFQKRFDAEAMAYAKEVPELAQPNSPLLQKLTEVFKEVPILNMIPDGVRQGHALLKLREQAAQSSAHEAEALKLRARVEELEAKLAIGGATPPGPPAPPKKFEDLPEAEMRSFLQRAAERADGVSA